MGLQVPLFVQVQTPAQFFPNLPLGHTVKMLYRSVISLVIMGYNNNPLYLISWNSSLGAGNSFEIHPPRCPCSGCFHSTASLILNGLSFYRYLKPKILIKASQTRRHHHIARNLTSWHLAQGVKTLPCIDFSWEAVFN